MEPSRVHPSSRFRPGRGRRDVLRSLALTALVCISRVGAAGAQDRAEPERLRLAVLSPALAVIVRDLGLEPRMIARHGYDVWSSSELPVVGDQAGVDYEALIEAAPTHVLTEWGTRPLPPRLESLAKDRGWKVENYSTLTLADLRKTTERIASLDADQPAWDVHPLKLAMDRAWSTRAEGLERAGRVLLIISAEPTAASLGPGSAHHEILKLIGGVPAIRTGLPYQELDAEDVLHLAPEAIVLIRPRVPDREQRRAGDRPRDEGRAAGVRQLDADAIRSELGPMARLPIPAIRDGKVGMIDDPLALLPSTSLIGFADELASLLRTWSVDAAAREPDRPTDAPDRR